MHEGDTHTSDQESYTFDIQAVLREGAALAFPK